MAIDREPPIGARRRRVVRRLVPIGLGAALIFARRVAAARADGEIPPTAIRADGICQGFAYGRERRCPQADRRVRSAGWRREHAVRCDPIGAGRWLPPARAA